jgi:hypothetical protein
MEVLTVNIFKTIYQKFKDRFFPPPAEKINTKLVEDAIDIVVALNFNSTNFKFLFNYSNSLRYWQSVIKAIAFAESGFNPNEYYFERTMGYPSMGLLQLSYEDYQRYQFSSDKGLYDIETNIKLGMIILNRLVAIHQKYIFNENNYWAVLQPKNKRHQVFLNKLREYIGGEL